MKRWYVVQVYTGFEDVVKADLLKRVEENDLRELFGEVIVPTGESNSALLSEKNKKEKIFPGYIIVQMDMTGESYRLVSSVPRVSRFLGGESPMPLSDTEVDKVFNQMSGKVSLSFEKASFTTGSEIQITDGPFSGFVGIIEKVDDEHERLTVMVSIFGRMTPIELGFDQVER